MKAPFYSYRPVLQDDGQGGTVETLGGASVFWGQFKVHDDTLEIFGVDVGEDVEVGDIIVPVE